VLVIIEPTDGETFLIRPVDFPEPAKKKNSQAKERGFCRLSNIVNNATGTTTLSGAGTRVVNGSVENNGAWKVTGTAATYTGTFTNNGAYVSDPATQTFTDLIVDPTGYLVGGTGDVFNISNDFINQGTNPLWNTDGAMLAFIFGTDSEHNFYLPGADSGPGSESFAWQTLDITGQSIFLFDGNGIPGGALYVDEIMGLVISNSEITNIMGGNGLTLYYDPNSPLMLALNGGIFSLNGGGLLTPGAATLPIPATLLFVVTGLNPFIRLRKKRLI
jgi:hypothetical protein